MSISNDFRRATGVLFLRMLLGLIFAMQGFGKVFTWGISGVYQSVFASFESTWIPVPLLKLTAFATSWIELIGGTLLILGLLRHWAYLALAGVLLVVAYGHGLESPIWDLQHVFFRAALLATLLLLPEAWDRWHLDRLMTTSAKFARVDSADSRPHDTR